MRDKAKIRLACMVNGNRIIKKEEVLWESRLSSQCPLFSLDLHQIDIALGNLCLYWEPSCSNPKSEDHLIDLGPVL